MNVKFINDFCKKINGSSDTMFVFGEQPNIIKFFPKGTLNYREYYAFLNRHSNDNIWFIPGISDTVSNKYREKKERPKAEDNIGDRSFFICDVDLKDNFSLKEYQENKLEYCKNMMDKILSISFKKEIYYILYTGNGLQVCFYFQPKVFVIKSKSDYKSGYESLLKMLKAQTGLTFDSSTSSLVSLFRVPYSMNHKNNIMTDILYFNLH